MTLGQNRVHQVSNPSFDALQEAIDGPVIDVLYKKEYLNHIGRAVQLPLMDIAPAAVTM
jgi:hypothetical protein